MKILLTGHRGYLGGKVYAALPDAEVVPNGWCFSEMRGQWDVVIHLAGSKGVQESLRDPDTFINNNALKLIPFIYKNNIGRMILASTGGSIYGIRFDAKEEDACWEECPHPYAQSKFLAEEIVRSLLPKSCILRFANLYEEGVTPIPKNFETADPIVVYGKNQIRDLLPTEIALQVILRALDRSIEGTYNIGTERMTNITSLARYYATKRGVDMVEMPARPGDVQYISLDCTKAKQAGLL